MVILLSFSSYFYGSQYCKELTLKVVPQKPDWYHICQVKSQLIAQQYCFTIWIPILIIKTCVKWFGLLKPMKYDSFVFKFFVCGIDNRRTLGSRIAICWYSVDALLLEGSFLSGWFLSLASLICPRYLQYRPPTHPQPINLNRSVLSGISSPPWWVLSDCEYLQERMIWVIRIWMFLWPNCKYLHLTGARDPTKAQRRRFSDGHIPILAD